MLLVTLKALSIARVTKKAVSVHGLLSLIKTQRTSILLLRLIHPWQSVISDKNMGLYFNKLLILLVLSLQK